MNTNLYQTLSKNRIGGNSSKLILRGQNYPDTKNKITGNIPGEHRDEQKSLTKYQQSIKRIIHHDQMGFILEMQEWFNVYKSVNVIYHIIKMKDKNYLNRCREKFDKIQHPFIIKTLNKMGIGEYISK